VAQVFFARQLVSNYYGRFSEQQLPGTVLQITARTRIAAATLDALLTQLIRATQRDIVLEAHGNANGLTMPLTRQTRISAYGQTLDIVVLFATVENHLNRLARNNNLAHWQQILRLILPRNQHNLIQQNYPSIVTVRQHVNTWLTNQARRLFPARNLSDRQRKNELNRIIALMNRVRRQRLNQVYLASCYAGTNRAVLTSYRNFFGATRVCAPASMAYELKGSGVKGVGDS